MSSRLTTVKQNQHSATYDDESRKCMNFLWVIYGISKKVIYHFDPIVFMVIWYLDTLLDSKGDRAKYFKYFIGVFIFFPFLFIPSNDIDKGQRCDYSTRDGLLHLEMGFMQNWTKIQDEFLRKCWLPKEITFMCNEILNRS